MPKISTRVRLTKREVDKVVGEPGRDCWLFDTEVPGFGFRVDARGLRTFVLQYRTKGRQRRVTIGAVGALTADQARDKARALRQRVRDGGDPVAEREQARNGELMESFCQRYLCEHAELHKKQSSVKDDRTLIRLYVKRLDKIQVADVTRADVIALHQAMRDKPYSANRALALVSKMMNLAEKWGVRPDGSNPCRHVQRYKEVRRQTFLASAQLVKLGEVLVNSEREGTEESEPPAAIAAIRLLILTGARKSEILGLQWPVVNWERQTLDLADSKSGPKPVYLNPPALQVLKELHDARSDDSPWVIGGRSAGKPFVGLSHVWLRIRERAGLDGVRLHDLRHSFASVAAANGASLPVIGALLGHTQPATTARYAHLAADPLKEASTRAGERIAALMVPHTAGRVVESLPSGERRDGAGRTRIATG